MAEANTNPVILYDGVCGLCNGVARFVLKRDTKDVFRFASLQSAFAREVLAPLQISPADLDTIYVVLDRGRPTQRLLSKSDAVAMILRQLGGIWRMVAAFQNLPRALRDAAYELIARHRYRIFGKYEVCPLPSERDRRKFLIDS